jgi:transposase
MIFGGSTESSKNILEKARHEEESPEGSADCLPQDTGKKGKKPVKGHGRNSSSSYTGAERVSVSHSILKSGSPCPLCPKGKVYGVKTPGTVLRFVGRAPVEATVYELEKLRCNLCGEIFTAGLPESAGEKKYDEKGGAMIALLKYGSGFPFYRLEKLQSSLGIPLPASTQWEIVEGVAEKISPVFEELKGEAAQGEVIYNDDTVMKVLDLLKNNDEEERKGIFTSGIVSTVGERKIAIFMTGRNHAGENISDILNERESGSEPPIQMCDALSRNESKTFKTILANCLVHGRRNFVDVLPNFPKDCEYVIDALGKVYKNDELARERNLSPEERLRFHQSESGPVMEELHQWLKKQFEEKKVEPNSGLGKAISYMLKHWEKLTRFLEVAKAPLDNNICERALKSVILHRKNSLFYKSE